MVDDDPTGAGWGDLLAGEGHTVATAPDAGAMNDILGRRPADVIILDLMRPGNGLSELAVAGRGNAPPCTSRKRDRREDEGDTVSR